MNKQKILITGASGYLGHALVPIAATYADVIGVARNPQSVYAPASPAGLDLTNTQALNALLLQHRPDAIIHAAAVNPGGDEAAMDAVNHQASKVLAAYAQTHGSRLVMVSTETVHRGDKAPYADDAVPDPINLYGRTKAAGEQSVLEACPHALIARTSLIYGLSKIDRGTEGFRRRLASGQELILFDDVLRQPVTAEHLSVALCELACNHTQVSGTINLVGDEVLSRAEFGRRMLKYWQIETGNKVSTRSGRGIDGLPLDLRCTCELAASVGFALPGVTEVLESHQHSHHTEE